MFGFGRIAATSALTLCLVSCASTHSGRGYPVRVDRSTDETTPPVYSFVDTSLAMLISERGLEPVNGSGQIIRMGNLGLTAAHTLPRFRGLTATSEIILPELGHVRFEVLQAGVGPGERIVTDPELAEVEPVDRTTDSKVVDILRQIQFFDDESVTAMKHIRSFEAIADDWALLRLDGSTAEWGAELEIETGPIPAGTFVSVFRSSPDGRTLSRLDVPVVEITLEDPGAKSAPEGIVALWNPRRVETDGWSGGFVGRQDETGRWRLIGVLSASSIEDRLIFVSRPPRDVLEWFVQGGIGEPPGPAR